MFQSSIIFYLFILINLSLASSDLVVTSTTPVVMNTPIKFNAIYNGYSYIKLLFEFEDNTPQSKVVSIDTYYGNASPTFIYNFTSNVRKYKMAVRVYIDFLNVKHLVAQSSCDFELSSTLIGKISIAQNSTDKAMIAKSLVAVNRTLSLTIDLHDPLDYIKNNGHYSIDWSINNIKFNTTKELSLFTNLTEAKSYFILAQIRVYLNNTNLLLSANLNRTVDAKSIVNSITAIGEKVIRRDQTIDLNITCVGSPPFWFCNKIIERNTNVNRSDNNNNNSNDTCDFIYANNNGCNFTVTRYLRNNGTYVLNLQIKNQVSLLSQNVTITVLGVNNQPQLSFVILPVSCSILGIFIIIVGIGYHLKNRQPYTVEVADFDFQRHQDDLIEKSLIERIRESFSNSFKGDFMSSCRRSVTENTKHNNYSDLNDERQLVTD